MGRGISTRHEFHNILVRLDENQLNMLRIALFQLLLQVATAMLVFTKSKDLALEIL